MSAYSQHHTAVHVSDEWPIHADVDKRVVIKPENYSWTYSPMTGVEQMILDRIGREREWTTTVLRSPTNSQLFSHVSEGDQEVFVLEGTFTDERGEYPAGTYLRIPAGTSLTPRAGTTGVTLFVKSHPFAKHETEQTVIHTDTAVWHPGLVDGLHVMPLHPEEHVALVRWTPHTQFLAHSHWGGEEILVLDGVFYDEHDHYPKGTWIRSPHLSRHTPFTKEEGALIFVKIGHLLPSTL